MKWEIQYAEDGSLLTILASGEPDVSGFQEYLEEIGRIPSMKDDTPILCDFRQLKLSDMSSDMVRRIAEVHKEILQPPTVNPTAVVVSGHAEFGIVRMWEMLTDDLFLNHSVFYTMDEALDWLSKGKRAL